MLLLSLEANSGALADGGGGGGSLTKHGDLARINCRESCRQPPRAEERARGDWTAGGRRTPKRIDGEILLPACRCRCRTWWRRRPRRHAGRHATRPRRTLSPPRARGVPATRSGVCARAPPSFCLQCCRLGSSLSTNHLRTCHLPSTHRPHLEGTRPFLRAYGLWPT